MKRTTYILIAALLAILAANVGTILYMTRQDIQPAEQPLLLDGPDTTLLLPPCTAIELTLMHPEAQPTSPVRNYRRHILASSFLNVTESGQDNGTLTLSDKLGKYTSVSLTPDSVLQICFRIPDGNPDGAAHGQTTENGIKFPSIRMALPSGAKAIVNEWNGLKLKPLGLHRDTLSIHSADAVMLKDCEIGSLSIAGRNAHFFLKSGKVQNLYVDLDDISYWETTPDSFYIGTEWLSGSRQHTCQWAKGESDRIRWMPQTDKAELTLQLEQGAIITQDKKP